MLLETSQGIPVIVPAAASGGGGMKRAELKEPLPQLLFSAAELARSLRAQAVVLLTDLPYNFADLSKRLAGVKLVVAAETEAAQQAAREDGMPLVPLAIEPETRRQQLSQAILEAMADDLLKPGDRVIALYPGVEAREVDTITVISLGEHLERLTARDLQRLQTQVPLETLRHVVNVAVEIGREGREGKRVGTLLVVGQHRKVMQMSHEQVHDPFRGYSAKERQIRDARVRESVKEIAQLDGAFVIAADGTVIAAGRNIDAPADGVAVSRGLGSRHWAAAAISKATKAVAIAVSQSTGTVRIFQDGKVVLRIESIGRSTMKWRDVDPLTDPVND